jgi:hypothetical protein
LRQDQRSVGIQCGNQIVDIVAAIAGQLALDGCEIGVVTT